MKKTYRYLTIKIDLERETKRIKIGTEYTDKVFLVDIVDSAGGTTSFAEPIKGNFGKSLKRTLKKIVEELKL